MFFASGFAALMYQVIWYRVVGLFTGVDVRAATIVVAAYMLGIGAGSLAGGHLADKVTRSRSLKLFAICELCIGGFALFSEYLFYDLLYLKVGAYTQSYIALSTIAFIGFLWPTFFMGMSLPLLTRSLSFDLETTAQRVGALYGMNALGAAVGAFVTTWYFMRSFSFETTLWIGAWINLVIACFAFPLGRLLPSAKDAESTPEQHIVDKALPRDWSSRPAFWIAAYFLSGFIALSLEMVWFRILGVMLKATAFTFGSLLAFYIGGLALGTIAGGPLLRFTKKHGRVFLLLQGGVGVYAALSVPVMFMEIHRLPSLHFLLDYVRSYEPIQVGYVIDAVARFIRGEGFQNTAEAEFVRMFFVMYGAIPAMFVGVPAFLMGMSYPFMQRAVHRDIAYVGRIVGWLNGANIAGCVLGSVVTGLVLFSALGTAGTIRFLLLLTGVYLAMLAWVSIRGEFSKRFIAASSVALLLSLLVMLVPGNALIWAILHGTKVDRITLVEDGSGLSLIKRETDAPDSPAIVFVNGRGESKIPFEGIHSILGALPALLHPDPKEIALIGLGSGDTAFHIGGREETESITSVEIVGSQIDMLRQYAQLSGYGPIKTVFEDPRFEHIVMDGRFHLLKTEKRYDIIEADALRPGSSYSTYLYSEEYFTLLRSRLKAGGIAVTWNCTKRVKNAFVRVFPFVWEIGEVLIGSESDIGLDVSVIGPRLDAPFTKQYYGQLNEELRALLAYYVQMNPPISITPDLDRAPFGDINSDLHPKDEFAVPDGK